MISIIGRWKGVLIGAKMMVQEAKVSLACF